MGERRGRAVNVLKMAKDVLLHPLDFFYDIQFEGRAKYRLAAVMIALTIASRLLSLIITGFSYETVEPYEISVIIEATWIVVPWLTWAVSNWGVSTIIDGEGKFKDVLVSSSFVLTPYIVLAVPIALLTNLLSLQEQSIYTALNWFVFLWVVYLLLAQVKIIHDFEVGKTLWITCLTIIGMLVVWFIALLIYGLISQAVDFVIAIIKEINYRT